MIVNGHKLKSTHALDRDLEVLMKTESVEVPRRDVH